ncbi:acetyl-CoA C-acetyltransferase [Sedimentitalea sp.]|uniref:acetyl-CoA C-acetyltransferase n=1 Tax=Sedimentitalea sp. TaxID=2048915 RepID=UPI003297176D
MKEVVICEPIRTAVGGYGGMYKNVAAAHLAKVVIEAVIERTKIDPEAIDDVVFGQCYPNGEAPAIGRVALLDAGLPVTATGLQIDRRCGSGLQAVLDAAMRIQTGAAKIVLAGGCESMSRAEYYSEDMRWGTMGRPTQFHDRLARGRVTSGGYRYPVPGGMLETAENLRREYSITRQEQDELSVRSHQRAQRAIENGHFAEEIIPVTLTDRKIGQIVIDRDEHVRPDLSVEKLSGLKPILGKQDPAATVTAGNASGQNDGAAICVVTDIETAEKLGLHPFAKLVSWAVAGVEPHRMGIGPVPSTSKALERAGLELKDIDLIELNEAFAAQVLSCTREWGFGKEDFERMNVNGSGISLGHPVGATGVRILTTMLREMRRREADYGLETMCIGGGQGLTAIFNRVS